MCVSVCVTVCLLQSELIQAYKMMPQSSKEELIIFITVYQMDPVTEYTGEVEMHFRTAELPYFENVLCISFVFKLHEVGYFTMFTIKHFYSLC